ncbi:MAG: PD-(D/E)XK nuclease domain-containing protein, partial [Myxococcota bacterium]
DLNTNPDALWSFLWYAGYLKVTRLWFVDTEQFAAFMIPNREVKGAYRKVFQGWLSHLDQGTQLQSQLTKALLSGDATVLEQLLSRIMQTNLSYHDPAGRQPEKLYHGFVMGLLVYLEGTYEVRSNPESGYGRVDVLIKPRQAGKPGAVMELKVLQEGETIAGALKNALAQIRIQAYTTQLKAVGASPIHQYAALFDGKRVWLVTPKTWKARFGTPETPA